MAGHSKWLNTKHRKAEQDAKRGKLFTKIISELVTAARCGGDLNKNPRLRVAVDKALANNMTRETINRAIARGIGHDDTTSSLTTTSVYEGYGPSGIAIIVECLSDNRNRTTAKIRHAFNQYGGSLGITGSVSYLFKKQGIFTFTKINENIISEISLKANIDDIIVHKNGKIDIYSAWETMSTIHNALNTINVKPDKIEISMIPISTIYLNSENMKKLLSFIYLLKKDEDIKKIYHNGKISNKVVSVVT